MKWRFGLRSIRHQLIAWNALTLSVLVAALGFGAHYMARSYAMASIDRILADRAEGPPHRGPDFGGPDRGRQGGGPERGGFDGAGRDRNGPPDRMQQMQGARGDGEHAPPDPLRRDLDGGTRPEMTGVVRGILASGVSSGSDERDLQRPRFFDASGRPREDPGPDGRRGPDQGGVRQINNGQSNGSVTAPEPWDQSALQQAIRTGGEIYTTVTYEGASYRVLTHVMRPGGPPLDRPLGEGSPTLEGSPPAQGLHDGEALGSGADTRTGGRTGRIGGVVQVAYPLEEAQRAMAGLDQGLLALIPLGILGAWAGAAFLTDRVLIRVRKFAIAADKMGANDLSERLPTEGEDEFSDLGRTFNRLFDRLEQAFRKQGLALEQQRRFTADASHELKTPLTVIKGTASMALQGRLTEQRAREAVTEIDLAASSMSVLVQDLLYLARADAGALGGDRQDVLVMELFQRASGSFASLPGAKIVIDVDDPGCEIHVNEGEFLRLLANLLSNARRHTPADGTITLTSRRINGDVTLAIQDTGQGIAPEHLERLGERFYRADTARARDDGGTGLGLAIVKGIVEAHGASLEFVSKVGVGTTVLVRLPRAGV